MGRKIALGAGNHNYEEKGRIAKATTTNNKMGGRGRESRGGNEPLLFAATQAAPMRRAKAVKRVNMVKAIEEGRAVKGNLIAR